MRRLAAVQALYQMEVSAIGVEHVIREFTEHRFDRALEGDGEGATLASADEGFFADLPSHASVALGGRRPEGLPESGFFAASRSARRASTHSSSHSIWCPVR